MEESNSRFRGKFLGNYSIDKIMGMIHGYIPNDLYVGDYVVLDKIFYRFAGFYSNMYAILLPDKILGGSRNSFSKVINMNDPSYINRKKIPELLANFQFPVVDARLMTLQDIATLPLFLYNKSYIRECFGNPYVLQEISDDRKHYKSINKNGNIVEIEADAYSGVRPIIMIGYSIIDIS